MNNIQVLAIASALPMATDPGSIIGSLATVVAMASFGLCAYSILKESGDLLPSKASAAAETATSEADSGSEDT